MASSTLHSSCVRRPGRAGQRLVVVLVVLAVAVLAGCTTLTIDTPGAVAGRRFYVGLVMVDAPLDAVPARPAHGVRQLHVTTLGLRLADGPSLSLGYAEDRLLSIPADCRLVIFIRSSTDLAQAEHLLRLTTQEKPCSARLSD